LLRFLSIRHLAVIDRLELDFEPGFNVLTGETGAGKSILVGAVGLLVGGRASPARADRRRAAAVEAVFEPRRDEVIVRREFPRRAAAARLRRRRACTSAARGALSEDSSTFGQHDTRSPRPRAHRRADEFAGGGSARLVADAFGAWQR
jgi:DNA repair protein RecN (Recombination protein N)